MGAPEPRIRAALDKQWAKVTKAVAAGLKDGAVFDDLRTCLPRIKHEAPNPAPPEWEQVEVKHVLRLEDLSDLPTRQLEDFGRGARLELWQQVIAKLVKAAGDGGHRYEKELSTKDLVVSKGPRVILVIGGSADVAKKLQKASKIDRYVDLTSLRSSPSPSGPAALFYRTINGPYLELDDLELGWDPIGSTSVHLVLTGGFRVRGTADRTVVTLV